MAHEEKLPWEMIEEILSRVPPKSLVCFRTVSKKWNALFEDKTFLNNHKSAFRFILTNKSKFYSVSIDAEVVVRELKLGIPDFDSETLKKLLDCDEFLLCTILSMAKEAVVWNPWLNQTRVIKCQRGLRFLGIGYDSNRRVKENGYKAIASYWKELEPKSYWTVYDFATDVWTERKSESSGSNQGKLAWLLTTPCVSLNGTLYGIAYHDKTDPLYHLHAHDLSSERYFTFCYLPCAKNHPSDALLLGVFKGERFSLLKQCHATKKIEIWVTKNKISNDDDVVWMTFMELSIPNVPVLEPIGNNSQPSYFIDDKRLVICSCDEIGRAWIYVIGKNKLINKIQVDSVVGRWPLHCTYSPSLVPVPQGPREEAEVQV